MAERADIVAFCAEYLAVEQFRDAAVNGLQVEGQPAIERMALAVSASQYTIRAAADWGAQALLVHHGLLWGERLGPVVGPLRQRLGTLLAHDINLLAYHLPLDAHPDVGNNVLLAAALGLTVTGPFAHLQGTAIGVTAETTGPVSLSEFAERVRSVTNRQPTVLDGGPGEIQRVAVVSGSGYSSLDEAAAAGCDLLLTGDVRESTMALARELGVTVIAAGHEATERLGVQALGDLIARTFEIETWFIADPNPI